MFDAPFKSAPLSIKPEWIDYNGHLNMAYYNVLMDNSSDQIFEALGLGETYRETTGFSTFSAEYHMHYHRELHLGDTVYSTFHLLDFDEKRFHFFQELYHVDGWLSASGEGMGLHIDLSGPKVAPMPEHLLENMRKMHEAHQILEKPALAGRPMGIRRK